MAPSLDALRRAVSSPRLDLPLAVAAWLGGFVLLSQTGSWLPLTALTGVVAARSLVVAPGVRRLLAPSVALLAVGFAAAAVMIAVTYLAWPPIAGAVPGLRGGAGELYSVLNPGGYSRLLLTALIAVTITSEEVVWRGRPLGASQPERSAAGLAKATLLAALYAASHATSGSWVLVAIAFCCGLYWGLLRVATGSLWPALVSHALWDLAVLVLAPLPV